MSHHERVLLDGVDGKIEIFVEPRDDAIGIALIAHPHPLYGGTAENKVVTTLAKAFRELGYTTLRPNFRGVGGTTGEHDFGIGETDDLLAVHAYARQRFGGAAVPLPAQLPVVLSGFSFGAYVITRLAKVLAERNDPAERLVLVGTAAGHFEGIRQYSVEAVAGDTVVIHGAEDTTVPLANVLAWAEPLDLPVVVIPGADHFFHRKLHIIRNIVHSAWHR